MLLIAICPLIDVGVCGTNTTPKLLYEPGGIKNGTGATRGPTHAKENTQGREDVPGTPRARGNDASRGLKPLKLPKRGSNELTRIRKARGHISVPMGRSQAGGGSGGVQSVRAASNFVDDRVP